MPVFRRMSRIIAVVVLVVLLAFFFPLAFSESSVFDVLFSQNTGTCYCHTDSESGLHSACIDKLPYDGCAGGGKSDTGVLGIRVWDRRGRSRVLMVLDVQVVYRVICWIQLYSIWSTFPLRNHFRVGWLCTSSTPGGFFHDLAWRLLFSYACSKTRPCGDAEPHDISSQCMAVGKWLQ